MYNQSNYYPFELAEVGIKADIEEVNRLNSLSYVLQREKETIRSLSKKKNDARKRLNILKNCVYRKVIENRILKSKPKV